MLRKLFVRKKVAFTWKKQAAKSASQGCYKGKYIPSPSVFHIARQIHANLVVMFYL